MPDWEKLVRERLTDLAFEPHEQREVIAELAAHLEETYEALLREGMTGGDAVRRALSQVNDWNDLQRKIHSSRTKENTMTPRVTQLWLPGLLTFVLSSGILAMLQIYGPKPWILARDGNLPLAVIHIPWLLALPLVGAMGAYLSWRAGGSQRAMLSSIVFPVLPFLASILVVLPFSLIFDRFIGHSPAPIALFIALFGWVLAPGAALLAGGLLMHFLISRRSDSRGLIVS
jgi:hypothetical protein